MSLTSINDLKVKVILDMPRRPSENLVLDALRSAWREFLIESEVWREDLTAFDAVEDQATYTLTPSDGDIKRIIKVELNEQEVSENGYYLDGTNTLTFKETYIPSEDVTDGIEVEVALYPEFNGTEGPVWVLNRWSYGITAGAQAELFRQQGRPWYNPEMYLLKDKEFRKAMGEAVVARSQQRTTRITGFSS